jgi:hypothetical protein
MTEGEIDSRLRPPEKRVLLGYGPAVVVAVAFLLMALLVPTVAPEQNVSSGATTGGSGNSPTGAATGLPASGVGPSSGTTVAGQGGGGPQTAGSGGSAGAHGGSATGGSGGGGANNRSAPAHVAACSGRQVNGDPYSPACISFSGGNGGATSRGVTANQIVVSYRIPADNISSVDQAIQTISGKYNSANFSDTEADIARTLNDLVTYFNDHFQFYGRKIVVDSYHGQGQLTEEVTDAGQAQANSDALTVADQLKAFADVSALSQPYAGALAAQHVVNIGAPYMSQQWFQSNAPYSYSFFPDCTSLADVGGATAPQIFNQKVTWGGQGVSDGQTRRIALIAPDNPVYQQCASVVSAAYQNDGHPLAANISYTLDLSQLSQEAQSIEQQIVNNHITTVVAACDPILLIYLTGDLANAHYEPEFVNAGVAFTDEDLLAQLFNQGSWAYAAGVTNNGTEPAYGSSLGYFAAKSVDPNNPPAHEVDQIYEDLYILALGIQLAGPNLTPQTFEQGLFNYAGGSGEYGPWSFNVNGTGAWTPQHQYRYEWWNPNAVSSYDQEAGTWVVGSQWYTAKSAPSGPAPVFPNGPQ